MSPPVQKPIFRPLEQLRAHELVADQIRRQIALRLVSPGQSLPPERELARLFGVGRATVQQAIELLEHEQLLESRRGRSGGTFVISSAQGDETPVTVLDRVRKERRRFSRPWSSGRSSSPRPRLPLLERGDSRTWRR